MAKESNHHRKRTIEHVSTSRRKFTSGKGSIETKAKPPKVGKGPLKVWHLLTGKPLSSSESTSERINPIEGLSALSLDALTSVAYGPEAMLGVLVVGGTAAMSAMLPITGAIVVLLAVLVVSYRQVIEAYPGGGGAYAVSKANLGKKTSLLAGASLIVDYTLTVAVSIAAGVGALTSAFSFLDPYRVPLCLAILAIITIMNLRGLGETARAFLLPTTIFVLGIFAVIAIGLIHPFDLSSVKNSHSALSSNSTQTLGVLLILKAFSAGCSALTGVEAIANGVPLYKEPKVKRAKLTELMLGMILGSSLIGLAVLATKWHISPNANRTVLSQIMAVALGKGVAYYFLSIIVILVLALAANTSFGGLPILASLLSKDNYLPHRFSLRGDRQVFSTGIWTLAILSALLLVSVGGDTNSLIPLFAIGVFIGFTLSQSGLVVHWFRNKPSGWKYKAAINGTGALLSAVSALIFLFTKFIQGAWIIVIAIPLFIYLFQRINAYYRRVESEVKLGTIPAKPVPKNTTVVVPIAQISLVTRDALTEALSLSDDVIALYIDNEQPDSNKESGSETPKDNQSGNSYQPKISEDWAKWDPGVQLVVLHSDYSSIVSPIVDYIDEMRKTTDNQIVVMIPVMVADKARFKILHNHIDMLLSAALSGHSDITVARIKYVLEANNSKR